MSKWTSACPVGEDRHHSTWRHHRIQLDSGEVSTSKNGGSGEWGCSCSTKPTFRTAAESFEHSMMEPGSRRQNSAVGGVDTTPAPVIRFVASDGLGLPTKRTYATQACESCRKRKKRCLHTDLAGTQIKTTPESNGGLNGNTRKKQKTTVNENPLSIENDKTTVSDLESQDEGPAQADSPSSFVCDMNPESVFIQAAAPDVPEATGVSEVGIWRRPISQSSTTSPNSLDGVRDGASRPRQRPAETRSQAALLFEQARRTYIEQDCLTLLPPDDDYKALKAIFVAKIHPLCPVLKDADLDDNGSSVYDKLARQLIALAAAADVDATQHLRLRPRGPLLKFQDFHRQLATAVLAVLEAEMVGNRLDLIRLLAMLALFYQPTTTGERDKAALLCSQALHHFYTIGAHLAGYRPKRDDENVEGLFCVVWAMDRLIATFYSRPCLFHDRDADQSLDACMAKQPPGFRLFMTVIQYLDKVINLYRPHQPFETIDIPAFEVLAVKVGAAKLSIALLGTLEILYHTVSVLSCRQLASAYSDNPPANDFSYVPHSSVNSRRSLSADRTVWITKNQPICPFLFVPYGVSLALTVQYRKMRYSQMAMFRNRARVQFQDIILLLKRLGKTFASARVNAGLGESILKQMNKTACTLAHEETEKVVKTTKANSNRQRAEALTPTEPLQEADPALVSDYNTAMITPASTETPDLQAYLSDGIHAGPPLFDNLDDIDLFGYFDPNFNLDTINTALEANLDLGIPQNWTIPWEDINMYN